MPSVYDAKVEVVTQIIVKNRSDHLKGFAPVVPCQVFDVFEQESFWFVVFQNFCQLKEKGPLRFACESMWGRSRRFFGNSRNRNGLTWKTGQQDIVAWDVLRDKLPYIARDFLIAKISAISLLAVFVPLTGEQAVTADGLKTQPHPTNACKDVYEGELVCHVPTASPLGQSQSSLHNST